MQSDFDAQNQSHQSVPQKKFRGKTSDMRKTTTNKQLQPFDTSVSVETKGLFDPSVKTDKAKMKSKSRRGMDSADRANRNGVLGKPSNQAGYRVPLNPKSIMDKQKRLEIKNPIPLEIDHEA
jgi:hypothetical protein